MHTKDYGINMWRYAAICEEWIYHPPPSNGHSQGVWDNINLYCIAAAPQDYRHT